MARKSQAQAKQVLLTVLALALSWMAPGSSSAQGYDKAAFIGDYEEAPYLTQWAEQTFPGSFPTFLWNPSFPVCQGFTGVSCSVTPDSGGILRVTSIELSQRKLPQNIGALRGSLIPPPSDITLPPPPPLICGLLFLSSLTVTGISPRSGPLVGELPGSISYCLTLRRLNLENNKLTGPIPEQLCKMGLSCLNLAGNNFTGRIPACLSSFPCQDFQNNTSLERRNGDCNASANQSSCFINEELTPVYAPPPPQGPKALGAPEIVAIFVGALVGVLLLALGLLIWRRKRNQRQLETERLALISKLESEVSSRQFGELRRFTSAELEEACDGFDEDNLVGEGGCARVYKGTLPDGKTVAVKKWKMEEMMLGMETRFLQEVEVIGRVSHKNLVECLGFCIEYQNSQDFTLMLVLTFYPNGSVASRTREKEGDPLGWDARRDIALGAAEGVAYLHGSCDPPIIHKDIKAANVLLSAEDRALVADFGLATELETNVTHRTMAVQGSLGHIAPEYILQGRCSTKTDVYAFGVFLLELITGQEVMAMTERHPSVEEIGINGWLNELAERHELLTVIDPILQRAINRDDANIVPHVTRVLGIAATCTHIEPELRPTMAEVVRLLSPVGEELPQKWEVWQEKGSESDREMLVQLFLNPSTWDNQTTGVKLDPGLKLKPR